jgi:glycosyltransferase involved in cell wall biosynthesis
VIVSRVSSTDYGSNLVSPETVDACRRRLSDNRRIRWYPYLEHERVLAELESAHIGLLPTLVDTFGYSVLESFALGIPVVTTNVNALPEFVDDSVGWLIELPLSPTGYWSGLETTPTTHSRSYEEARELVVDGLIHAVAAARSTPDALIRRSTCAVDRVRRQFGPDVHAEALMRVYSESLRGSKT